MSERGLEAAEEDVVEQQTLVVEDDEGAGPPASHDSDEVDPADRADQERTVALDEDEYR
jgi:hypothetical protein